jgi:hypothetical protein
LSLDYEISLQVLEPSFGADFMDKRRPAKGQVKTILRIFFPALLVLVLVYLGIIGVLTYRVTYPGPAQEPVNPSQFLIPSAEISWPNEDGTETKGWLITVEKEAPGIVLAPGYGMSRSDMLSLATSLYRAGFHVLIYAQRGFGTGSKEASTLGLRETADMAAALESFIHRPGVDKQRIGIWGEDEGARAALSLVASHPEIIAVAADTPYENVLDFFVLKVRAELGYRNWLLEDGCRELFRLIHFRSFSQFRDPLPVEKLGTRNIIFIHGANRKDMSPYVTSLHERIQPRKEMITTPGSRTRLLTSDEQVNYDRQVMDFFRINLTGNAGLLSQ